MRKAGQNRIQSFAFVISVCVAVCFSTFFVSNLLGHESSYGGCKIELENLINPNNACIESLVRLPGLGIGRAGAIVAYRENFSKKNNDGLPFRNCDDLQIVKGIGPKTTQNIQKWLHFE